MITALGGNKVLIKADEATIKAAQMAIDCQTACNGLGVLNSLVQQLPGIAKATDDRNQHPVVITVLDKLCSLARIQEGNGRIDGAYQACHELALGLDVEWEII